MPLTIRAAAVVAALALAGCGSTTAVADLPPAAGPDASPPLTTEPAGRVVALRELPEPEPVTAAGRTFRLEGDRLVAGAESVRVAAEPADLAAAGDLVAVVSGRERVLELYDARTLARLGRAYAGAGPTHVVAGVHRFYVVDTTGDALLVFRWRPELALDRRVALVGAPYGIAVDRVRGRLWVTLTATNEVAELAAGTRPRILRTLPAVRQPDRVAVTPGARQVLVRGADAVQVLDLSR